jgi:peptidoglycan/xylan/chitin deacetylase (PgdA/CDA1 family)
MSIQMKMLPQLTLFLALTLPLTLCKAQGVIALSFDDPNTAPSPLMTWQERNQKILQTLAFHQLKTVLFVCSNKVNDPRGRALVNSWDKVGHAIANHSATHPNFGSKKATAAQFEQELIRCDSFIAEYANVTKLFRFPFLKEGFSAEKRDSMRQILEQHGYRNGYVSIDASDWYVDLMLCDSLRKNQYLDPRPYKEFYVSHILERANYYDSLAVVLTGRKVQHVLLVHHNLLNAMFLDDVIRSLTAKGWAFHQTLDAYKDPIYREQPDIVPAGEGIIWALAKAQEKHAKKLRYPAEDSEYEAERLRRALQKQ